MTDDKITKFCDVQVCHQRLSSAFDLLIFLCSLIQTLTPPPNNGLLANMDMLVNEPHTSGTALQDARVYVG